MNINDIHPDEINSVEADPSRDPASSNIPLPTNLAQINPDNIQTEQEFKESKYGSLGQQAIAGLEGVAQGVAGPLAPAAEIASGVTSGEDIRGRSEINPITHGIGEGAGLVGSVFAPELKGASLAGVTGAIGEHAAGLIPELGTVAKIAQSGVKTGAEFAALQASDELSKMVTQDPTQSLNSAAMNIGLAGILGGAGGTVLGTVSPLWKSTMNKLGVTKLASDFMGETKFLTENPDLVEGASKELSGRMAEADNLRSVLNDTKPEALMKAMPENTPANAAKIDKQVNDISEKMTSAIEDAAKSVKTKSAVPFLAEDLNAFQEAVTNPNATFADKFSATNKLKTTLQSYAKWGATEEGSAKGALGRELSNIIKPALEDSKVWGKAADVQKVTNEATTNVIRATKDFVPKVTSAEMNGRVVDPNKVRTFLGQVEKGKGGVRENAVRNYLDYTQKQADAIARVHLDNGLESPISSTLNPTTILDHGLNTPSTPGVELARWARRGGAAAMGANAAGHIAGEAVGGGLGFLVGHPLAGAWMGDKILKPVFAALAKPIAEKAINATAARAAVDYVGNVSKGQNLLKNAARNFFKAGAEIIPKDDLPNAASRDRLEKSLEYASNPDNMSRVSGDVGHYLPDHSTAAGKAAAAATQYFSKLKPQTHQSAPLDKMTPVDPIKQAQYDRQLDIASQPLLALKHVKNGTLQDSDLQTMDTIYPGLRQQMSGQVYNEMIESLNSGGTVPYKQRIGLSKLMGQPLDSSMRQPIMQTISLANAPRMPQAPQMGSGKKPSRSTASSMLKASAIYQTPSQARSASRLKD